MPHREVKDSAAFLPDVQSQRLCLEDALKSGSPSAMLHALQAVAVARGVQKLARDIGLTAPDLDRLLASEDEHQGFVADKVEQLIASIASSEAASILAKTAKNSRAGSKTGRAAES